jgi:hypothetical protein
MKGKKKKKQAEPGSSAFLWCSVLHLVIWPNASWSAICLSWGPTCLRVVLWPYQSSLGCTHCFWVVHVVVGPNTSTLCCVCPYWAVNIAVGLKTSLLGCTCHPCVVHICKGNCGPSSLGAETSKSGRGSKVSLLRNRHRY